MIDIHCHILPDFDDGAADLDESLGMVRTALASGVTDIIVTPHFMGKPAALDHIPLLLNRYQLLRAALDEANLPLGLHLGAEVLCLPETPRMARQKQLPTLGDTDYVLCEFYFNESAVFMDKVFSALAVSGYKIVVAHPERYEAVQKDLRIAQRWFRQGHILQVNKGSPLGAFGARVQRTAESLLDSGLVHIVASDAHGTLYRDAEMLQIRAWLSTHCSPAYARVLLEENPLRLLRGQDMVPPE